ncbi:MAG: AAA domain-containing protein, partial [Verrucomicrobiota bacterium]
LASHYWEGRWLLELEKIDNEAPTSLYGSVQNDIEGFFRRLSMLTPCLGSTLHMMPKLLNAFVPKTGSNVSLFDFVDLLIMDEAGQVAPEIGMTGLSFAKKALVIGDTDQIEPVRAFGEHEDIKLIKEYSLIDVYEDIKERGLTISSGNMMQIAKVQSACSINDDTQGMFLSDHWRCVPEIINYCNKLVYKGLLNPQKPSSKITEFPAMGFAHIPSQSMKRGGSRCNPLEAKSIADWIAHNSEKLRSTFGKGKALEDIIGVVTPFAAQAGEITKALKTAGIKNRIQVGTVHRFQGGEKDIMIFSSVYGKDDDVRSYFFDNGKNMMNVAVSRAKESFLVFGDMRIFANQSINTPSGLLGSYLLSDPEQNEITDVIVPTRVGSAIETQCQRVRTLKDHRKALHEALTQSQERIIIMSAFLSINAIEQDDIINLLKDAGERGVKRLVLYDVAFNKDKKRAERTLAAFEEAGVPIHGVNGIHHKTLAYDSEFYMDGSFNWLSAQRDSTHKFHNQEGSLLVRGAEAKDWIDQTWEEALALVKSVTKK